MKSRGWTGGRRCRLVIYCRISLDREGRKYGVKRQERECRQLAEQLEHEGIPVEIAAVLIENDTSAYSGKPRPKYARLIEMLREDEADGVLALTSRRLQRRFREAFEFLDLVEEKDLLVATVKGGTYDLTTADGRREARRKAIDDQHEAEEISERVRDAKADNVREGTYRGGPRPFGYEADGATPRALRCPACPCERFEIVHLCRRCGMGDALTPDRICTRCESGEGFDAKAVCADCGTDAVIAEGSEAWELDQAMDVILAGDSLRGVCRDWKVKGIRTVPRRKRLPDGTRTEPTTAEFVPSVVRKLLLRPRNAGLLEVAGEVIGRAAWPAITSEDKYRAVKAVFERPERRNGTSTARKWLGGDLYLCGWAGCSQTMQTLGRGVGLSAAYRCRSGGHVSRVAEYVDEYVEEWAVERLSRPDAVELLVPPEPEQEPMEELVAREEAVRAKLQENQRDYDDDLKTRAQYLDSNARLRARLREAEQEMARRNTVPVLRGVRLGTPQVAEDWKRYSLDRKRAIIGTIMTVTILPARRGRPDGFRPGSTYFDERSVRIEPRRQRD